MMIRFLNSVVLLWIILVVFSVAEAYSPVQNDGQALMAFKAFVTSDPQQCLDKWNLGNSHFCNWTGISCSRDFGRVVGINLTGMHLQGFLPALLGNISTLDSLKTLNLSSNEFHGSIPLVLGSLPSLQILNLADNHLSGNIPLALANLSSLVRLDVSNNNLSGSIPPKLGMLENLNMLDLSQNVLTGSIPPFLSNISSLTDLSLYQNNLRGQIPWQFGKLRKLNYFSVWGNQLTGPIPKTFGNCSSLTMFIVSSNNLSGSIPVELGRLSSLVRLKLHKNQLDSGGDKSNKFITALTNCSVLEQLSLGNNKLTGTLPDSIGRLSRNLSLLEMTGNFLSGSIPMQIGNLSALTFLALNWNVFTGKIPVTLSKLTSLERLQLQHNQLVGKIPVQIAKLSSLGILDLSDNLLSGRIPDVIASLKQLRQLILHHNNFSGTIPSSLGYCYNLELLDLSYNLLSGAIPREIGKLSDIQLYFNLSSNLLSGQLPAEISSMIMVQAIDVSSNKLYGRIPYQIESCRGLQWLNLSRNYFSGSIPEQIGNLQSLISLDLSSNSLSETVPISDLNGLKFLQYLNLSYNMLIGQVVKEDFNSSVSVYLQGNPDLCGSQQLNISACPRRKTHSKMLWILLPIISAVALTIVVLLIFRAIVKKKEVRSRSSLLQQILYEELSEATDGFSESHLLGRGGYGSVYKGVLSDGKVVAIKVIGLLNDEVTKSFIAECRILSSIRHRNLVKLISSSSTPNFKGLVYEFMPNGSLEDHLYAGLDMSNKKDDCMLQLKLRFNIAMDVAHALEYLHHDCFVQIVHCDIKPPNVLLDEDMTAHLSDFGISRLIQVPSGESIASTVYMRGTMGYIAPEYGLVGRISTKGDVYSYGILLLEILTRRRPTSEEFDEGMNLHKWVGRSFPVITEILDPSLLKEIVGDGNSHNSAFECLISLFRIGLLCSKERPEERPTMRDVSRFLESLIEHL